MDLSLKNKLYEVFIKYNFAKEDAGFVADVLKEIDERQATRFDNAKELFLTQKDKVEILDRINEVKSELADKINSLRSEFTSKMYISVFSVGLIQIIAIIGAVVAIISNTK